MADAEVRLRGGRSGRRAGRGDRLHRAGAPALLRRLDRRAGGGERDQFRALWRQHYADAGAGGWRGHRAAVSSRRDELRRAAPGGGARGERGRGLLQIKTAPIARGRCVHQTRYREPLATFSSSEQLSSSRLSSWLRSSWIDSPFTSKYAPLRGERACVPFIRWFPWKVKKKMNQAGRERRVFPRGGEAC